jgi:elongation factor G
VTGSAIARLRNIGIVAHINAGKTTLTERILFDSGKQRFMGEVDEGTATMDFLTEEQDRGISISAAVATVRWRDLDLNLVDMPGHVDFTAEVERCLRVLDGAIVLLDSVRGVESQTEIVWRQAGARHIPKIVFVNKMDRPGADFAGALEALRTRLDCRPLPIAVPLADDGGLCGTIDVATGETIRWRAALGAAVPAIDVDAARVRVIEACADLDEAILADFVHGRKIEPGRLRAALRRGVLSGAFVPVLGGAALLNFGVDILLDAVCDYLPAPVDLPPVVSVDEPDVRRRASSEEPFCALVFKTQADAEVGQLCFVRIYSGSLAQGQRATSARTGARLVVRGLWRVHADSREGLDAVAAGDIVALTADAELATGDTLHEPGAPVRLEPARFPEPVLTMAIEPATLADAPAVAAAARALARDDPTLRLQQDGESGDLLIAGMGELHLEVFGSRLRRAVRGVRLGRPRVAYRETVLRSGRASAECRASLGPGPLRRASVEVEIRPEPGASGIAVEDAGEGCPARRSALLAALAERARTGLAAPYPAAGVRLRLLTIGGDAEEAGDQGAVLFLEALDVACRKALAVARAVLLEPVMRFEVFAPADTLSGVLADLKARRARLEELAAGVDHARIRGEVKLGEVLGYATRLRSLTRGLGTVQLTPSGYLPGDEAENGLASGEKGLPQP